MIVRPPEPGERLSTPIVQVLADLERRHGRARILPEHKRRPLVRALSVGGNCLAITVGDGLIATVGARGGGLIVHDLRR